MTHDQFVNGAEEFTRAIIANRATDPYGPAIFALLYKAVAAGRTQEMFAELTEFRDDLRSEPDWPDLIV